MENDFFKPTQPTKVWKIPYFFLNPSLYKKKIKMDICPCLTTYVENSSQLKMF